MRVLVCGSRTWSNSTPIDVVLEGYLHAARAWNETLTIIEGGAQGADDRAASYARLEVVDTEHEQYPADWAKHGKAAGPIRNQQMLDEGKPDVVWAFVDKPLSESRGTADMVRRAKAARIPTYIVEAS